MFAALRVARAVLLAEPRSATLCVGVDVLPAGASREILYNVISDDRCQPDELGHPAAARGHRSSTRDPRADVLLRMAEIVPHYRTPDALRHILQRLPWRRLDLAVDHTGVQTFVTAVK